MSEWKTIALEELVDVDPEQLSSATDAGYTFFYIDISSVSEGSINYPVHTVKFRGAPSRARKVLRGGDILMSSVRPNLKAFAKFEKAGDFNFIGSTGFAVLRGNLKSDIDFIFHSLFSDSVTKQIENLVVGSNYPAINTSDIKKLKLAIPSLEQQKKISQILNVQDDIIKKTQTVIAKYQAIKHGMLHDLFTRGIDVKTGKLRPIYEQAPNLYKTSGLGMIPKEWTEERLGNRASIEYGRSQKAVVSLNGSIPIYGTGGIIEYSIQGLFDGESILIGRKGTIDKPFYINGEFWAVDTTYYLRSFLGNIRWLHSALMMFDLKKLNEATGVPSINREQLYNIRFAFPNNREQDEIVKRIIAFDQKIITEQTYLQKLRQLKSGLVNDLLSGKKKIKLATP